MFYLPKRYNLNSNGFIAITSILIISAVTLAISISVSLLSIGETQSALSQRKGESALYILEACAEDALLEINNDSAYAGGTINVPQGSCSATVSSLGNVYTVTVANVSSDYIRSIQIQATRTTTITIDSWKEL